MKRRMSFLLAMMILTTSQVMAAPDFGGGSPWLEGDIKANVTEATETSPKEDFNLYVNKDWILQSKILEGYASDSSFMEIQQETDRKSKEILTDSSLTGHNAELVRDYYQKFLDWGARNAVGLAPLQKDIDRIRGITSIDDVSKLMSSEEGFFLPKFLAVETMAKLDDASEYTVCVEPAPLLLSDAAEYKTRTSYGDRYYSAEKKAAVKVLAKLGYTEKEAEAMFDDVIAFEGRLAEASYTSAETMADDYYQRTNNMVTLDQLRQSSPEYPVADIIMGWGYGASKDYMSINPAYITRLNELYTEENLEHIKNYLIICSVLKNMKNLDRDVYQIYMEMNTALTGAAQAPDETVAYNNVRNFLTEPMNQVYLKKYDSRQMKADITEICKNVIAYYRTMLEQEDWLSAATKARAIKKLDRIKIHAAYPEKWYDYSSLNLSADSYYDASIKIARFNWARDQKRVNQKVNPDEWDIDILECNAYYNPSDNSINIMTGILGGRLYSSGMKEEALYAGIGSVIGHEISHAFDTNGAQFDENGNMANWWTDEDLANFKARAAKLSAYYDKIIPYTGEKVRGSNVQSEAIADMAGMKAMLAIMSAKQNVDYDLFFRSYAEMWKTNNTAQREEWILMQDSHPLPYLRVNVTLQQFEEFFKTYDIKEGDTMYLAPEDRILVW